LIARRAIALPAIAAYAALTGCASSPVTVRQTYAPPPVLAQGTASAGSRADRKRASGAAASPKGECSVHVMALADSRSDPTFLGMIGGRPVRSPGQGADWIGSMLSSGLKEKGVILSVAPAPVAQDPAVVAEARLVTAWVGTTSTSMNGTVVVAIRHREGAEERIYRGAATVMNWASGEGEIQSLLDRAFGQMLVKLSSDLRARCESGSG
jgi:hypothetical protein